MPSHHRQPQAPNVRFFRATTPLNHLIAKTGPHYKASTGLNRPGQWPVPIAYIFIRFQYISMRSHLA